MATEDVTDTEEEEEIVVEETEAETTEEDNPLDMDDEAFDELMSKGFETLADDTVTDETTTEEVVDEEVTEVVDEEVVGEKIEEEEDATEKEDIAESDTETTDETTEEVVEKTDKEKLVEGILDASVQLETLFSPFKANGKDMQVENIDDARTLMQMGANYNKKMAALKPNLKFLKMLENNNLLDENKLNYLIDLDKKNPGAVTKLVKDSNIDPDELDTEAESSYKPNTYNVNDKEVELDDTLNDIRDTPSYAQTLNIISNKWDESSKASLLDNPAGIKVLNDHVQMGVYDKVNSIVETERMFGRIPSGMSDLEAYRLVGEQINARGGFDTQPNGTSASKTVIGKTTSKVVDPKLNDKKKAASSTKSIHSSKTKETFNPLSMSDSEFEKLGMEKFLN